MTEGHPNIDPVNAVLVGCDEPFIQNAGPERYGERTLAPVGEPLTLLNSTVSGNMVNHDGGGIYAISDEQLRAEWDDGRRCDGSRLVAGPAAGQRRPNADAGVAARLSLGGCTDQTNIRLDRIEPA